MEERLEYNRPIKFKTSRGIEVDITDYIKSNLIAIGYIIESGKHVAQYFVIDYTNGDDKLKPLNTVWFTLDTRRENGRFYIMQETWNSMELIIRSL